MTLITAVYVAAAETRWLARSIGASQSVAIEIVDIDRRPDFSHGPGPRDIVRALLGGFHHQNLMRSPLKGIVLSHFRAVSRETEFADERAVPGHNSLRVRGRVPKLNPMIAKYEVNVSTTSESSST